MGMERAMRIFEKKMRAQVKPNELTFTGILTACVQAGLVDEGRRYFRMLQECGVEAKNSALWQFEIAEKVIYKGDEDGEARGRRRALLTISDLYG
ncbi:hypothetical protein BUALT_Bualt03G0000100 [Buddleja alternifolia]|uniref:Pentatricopeptide repeat-containing protein n=1 Tax=Buddleja alternifolia TaxID=168488 RepID=A0AAV6XU96_9LAMI|nr:hypothetical protein BUALT_Bualt03G0000100 [Buddleja alternifolia]